MTTRARGSRADLSTAARLVVKVGSSSLTSADGGLDDARVTALVEVLAAHRATGVDVVLVSSGAIAAGLGPLGLTRRPRDLATQQAAASVGQGLLVARYTAAFGRHATPVGQVLLTADDVIRRGPYARSGSVTTTGSRHWWRTWCRPTRCCCSPTSTPCTTVHRRGPVSAGCPRSLAPLTWSACGWVPAAAPSAPGA